MLWSGEEVGPGKAADPEGKDSPIRVRLKNRRTLWRILTDPFFQFPDAYCNGTLEIEGDLEALLGVVTRCAVSSPQSTQLLTNIARLFHWGSRNTLSGSQKNIHHHYDIGNDFYRLWLDENLLYTCPISRIPLLR